METSYNLKVKIYRLIILFNKRNNLPVENVLTICVVGSLSSRKPVMRWLWQWFENKKAVIKKP